MNKPFTAKARAFIAKNPTFIGRVNGVDLYEHPTNGDESPLVAVTATGRLRPTDYWELPDELTAEDIAEAGLE